MIILNIFSDKNKNIDQNNINITQYFLEKLCHQFRSYLNIIAFSNSLLKRNLLEQEDSSSSNNLVFSSNIKVGVEEISKLLDDLGFYISLKANEIKFQPNFIDIILFCNEIVVKIEAIAKTKKQTINFIQNDSCQMAYLDTTLLEPVLNQLLANAIKYSPENSQINLKLSFQKQKIIFQVQDRGIGIPAKDLTKIFEPFFRGSNRGDLKGNGLGLTIVKNLVEIQNGTIDVESEIGIGTTVTVTLPSIDETAQN